MRVGQLFLAAVVAACVSCSHARSSSHHYDSSPIIYVTNFRNSLLSFRLSDGADLGNVLVGADENTTRRAPTLTALGTCFEKDSLYLADQRAGSDTNGAVQRYAKRVKRGMTDFVRKNDFVGINAPNAAFAPQDILIRKGVAYVIDITNANFTKNGRIARFDVRTRKFLGDLSLEGLAKYLPSDGFHPTGAVFGPDGLLYVTARSLAEQAPGFVSKWDVKKNKFLGVLIRQDDNDPLLRNLHRPDSPRFGPDGTFTVNSFRITANSTDLDRIFVFPARRHRLKPYSIEIQNTPTGGRVYSQESVFGPGGKLYAGTSTGEIRTYKVPSTDTSYKVIVPADASRGILRTLAFGGKTDCATLAYHG